MSKTTTPETITTAQLASLANLTPRRIGQLGEEGKIPRAENGRLPMVQAIRELFAFYQRDSETLQREKMLKTTAERRLREHELGRVEGEWMKKAEVSRAAVGTGRILNAGLDRWLELRLRVMALEKFHQRPVTPPLSTEQITQVVDVLSEIGKETNLALKSDLRTQLYAMGAAAKEATPAAELTPAAL